MIVNIHDTKTTVSIDSLGAQLISLKDAQGKEYMWQRDPAVWTGCSPLLFPIVGNLRNDKTIIEGREYEMKRHGFAKFTEFSVSQPSDAEAVFTIRDTEDTKKLYPYSFQLTLTYKLCDGILSMDYVVKNTDSRDIYYCIGAHPGFNCPLEAGEKFSDYVLEFEQEETAESMTYDLEKCQFNPANMVKRLDHSRILPLDYELFVNDAVYFPKLHSRKVAIKNPSTGKGIEVSYPGFDTIAFWTVYAAKAPYVCVEPWNGSGVYATEDDQFTSKHDLQKLTIGEEKAYHLKIRIL